MRWLIQYKRQAQQPEIISLRILLCQGLIPQNLESAQSPKKNSD